MVVAEHHRVTAVGIDRVARQAALQLEIGKEVEPELLEGLGSSWQAKTHNVALFAGPDANPCVRSLTEDRLLTSRRMRLASSSGRTCRRSARETPGAGHSYVSSRPARRRS